MARKSDDTPNPKNGFNDVIGVALLALALLLVVAQLSFDCYDLPFVRNPPNKEIHNWIGKIGAYLAKNAFHSIRRRMDPEVYGGAPLLGFNGMVFKAHGSARERAVTSALRVTADAVQHQVNEIIAREIANANAALAAADIALPAPA